MTEPGSRRVVASAFGAGSGCFGASAGRHLCGVTGERNAGRRGPGGGVGGQVASRARGHRLCDLQRRTPEARGGHSAPQNLIRARTDKGWGAGLLPQLLHETIKRIDLYA